MILLTGLITVPAYSASPKIAQEYSGGIVFYLDGSGHHGLIVSKSDISGKFTWSEAKAACKNLEINGYSDWFLPDKDQLYQLYFHRNVLDGFADDFYWSSTESSPGGAWGLDFDCGCKDQDDEAVYGRVRPVRIF